MVTATAPSRTKKAGKKPAPISAAEIAEYVEVVTNNNKLAKRREKLRERLLPRLLAGAPCEAASPFCLGIQVVDKSAVVWKEEYGKLLMEYYPDNWQAKMDKLEADQRRNEYHVVIEPNVPALVALAGEV